MAERPAQIGARVPTTALAPERRRRARLTPLAFVRRLTPVGTLCLLFLLTMIAVAILAPVIAPYNPDEQVRGMRYAPPFGQFLMGGDEFGRDIFSRILFGARVSLVVGISSAIIGVTSGGLLGIASGYFGGKVDLIVQRVMDVLQGFPGLILAMILLMGLGFSLFSVIIAVAVPGLPQANRLFRSITLSVKESDYVKAARAIGAVNIRIMLLHILPQTFAATLVITSARVGTAITSEATLGFLGLGVPPPTATWGQMLSGASRVFFYAPWLAIFPGVALTLTIFSLNMLGDALRDILDPRLRGKY